MYIFVFDNILTYIIFNMSQNINVDINGEEYRTVPGNQTDGRSFSGAVFYSLNGRFARDDELNDWIRDNIIVPIQKIPKDAVAIIDPALLTAIREQQAISDELNKKLQSFFEGFTDRFLATRA